MTISVPLLKHDLLTIPLTVLLQCPITSMMYTLSYRSSNRVGDNQSFLRILLYFLLDK